MNERLSGERMRSLVSGLIGAALVAAAALLLPGAGEEMRAQTAGAGAFPRIAGKPNLTGVWQALNTAAWDLEDHVGQMNVPAGLGVVEGGEIPYLPAAAAKKKENYEKRATLDPETKCFMPGVPRATYMPYPFQIVQGTQHIAIAYEFAHAARRIYMDGSSHPPELEAWMGDSRGRWEGDTLVVDVRNFNDQTWFDRAGNFHSEALHIIERYTPITPNHLNYEVTVEDPKVFSRPWKMSMPLYRRMEKNIRMLEYECVSYLEDEKFGVVPR